MMKKIIAALLVAVLVVEIVFGFLLYSMKKELDTRDQAAEARIAALEQGLERTAGQAAAAEAENARLSTELAALSDRIDGLEANVQAADDALAADIDALMTDMVNNDAGLAGDIAALTATVTDLDARVTAADEELAADIEALMTDMVNNDAGLAGDIAALAATVTDLDARVTAADEELAADIEALMTDMVNYDAGLAGDIAALTATVTDLQEDVLSLTATVTDLDARMTAADEELAADIGALMTDMANNDAGLATDLAAVIADVDALKMATGDLMASPRVILQDCSIPLPVGWSCMSDQTAMKLTGSKGELVYIHVFTEGKELQDWSLDYQEMIVSAEGAVNGVEEMTVSGYPAQFILTEGYYADYCLIGLKDGLLAVTICNVEPEFVRSMLASILPANEE